MDMLNLEVVVRNGETVEHREVTSHLLFEWLFNRYSQFGQYRQYDWCSLEYARNVLEEMGHRATSQELYRLNGPRIYTI